MAAGCKKVEPFPFTLQWTVIVSSKNGEDELDCSGERLGTFLNFLQNTTNETIIKQFFWDNTNSGVCVKDFKKTDEDDGIDCSMVALSKEGFAQLYDLVTKKDFSQKFTTFLESNGLRGAIGPVVSNKTRTVIVELPKKTFLRGIRHFDDQHKSIAETSQRDSPKSQPYEFPMNLTLCLKKGDDEDLVNNKTILDSFTKFFSRKRTLINDGLFKTRYTSVAVEKYEISNDCDSIDCSVSCTTKDGLELLYDDVKSSGLMSKLSEWLETNGVNEELGLSDGTHVVAIVEILKKWYIKGVQHFGEQAKRPKEGDLQGSRGSDSSGNDGGVGLNILPDIASGQNISQGESTTRQPSASSPSQTDDKENLTSVENTQVKVKDHINKFEKLSGGSNTSVVTSDQTAGTATCAPLPSGPPTPMTSEEGQVITLAQTAETGTCHERPSDRTMSMSSEGGQAIWKTFILHIPSSVMSIFSKPPLRASVVVNSAFHSEVSLKQDKIHPYLWTSPLVRFNMGTTNEKLHYGYNVHFKKSKNVLAKWWDKLVQNAPDEVLLLENSPRPLESGCDVHRDTFLFSQLLPQDRVRAATEGFYGHINIMSANVTEDTLKAVLSELEYLDLPENYLFYRQKSFTTYLTSAFSLISKNQHWHACSLFLLSCLSLFRFTSFDVIENNLSSEMAALLVRSLADTECHNVITSRVKSIGKLMPSLLKCAFGRRVPWAVCLDFIFPFFPVDETKAMRRYFDKSDFTFTSIKSTIDRVLARLSTDKQGLEVLEGICEECNFSVLIEVEAHLKDSESLFLEGQLCDITNVIQRHYIKLLHLDKTVEVDEITKRWKHVLNQISFLDEELTGLALSLRHFQCILQVFQCVKERDIAVSHENFEEAVTKVVLTMYASEVKRNKDMHAIKEKWEIAKSMMTSQMLESTAQIVRGQISLICSTYRSSSTGVTECLKSMWQDRTLFPTDQSYADSMTNLATFASRNGNPALVEMLRVVQELPVDGNNVLHFFFKGEFDDVFGASPLDEVIGLYKKLFSFLEIQCLSRDPQVCQKLDNMVVKRIKSIGVDGLVQCMEQFSELDKRSQDKLEEHLKDIVASSAINKRIYAKKEKLEIPTKLHLVLTEKVLESQKIPEYDRSSNHAFLKTVAAVLKDSSFWRVILSAEGDFAVQLNKHPVVKKVKQILLHVWSGIHKRSMSVYIASKIIKAFQENEDNGSIILVDILRQETDFREELQNTEKLIQQIRRNVQQLREFKTVFLKMCSDDQVKDKEQFSLDLEDYERQLNRSDGFLLATIAADSFWGPIGEMIPHVEGLEKLKHCEVFRKFCHKTLANADLKTSQTALNQTLRSESGKEENDQCLTDVARLFEGYNTPLVDEENNEDDSGVPVTVVAEFLMSEVLAKFKSCVQPFFEEDDISVTDVCSVFDDCQQLEDEISFIEMYFQKTLGVMKLRNPLLDFQKYKQLKNQASSISKTLQAFKVKVDENDELQSVITSVQFCRDRQSISLVQVSKSVQFMESLSIDDQTDGILSELSHSKKLVTFLEENHEEDFRNLIDAVEEHSESFVRDAQVSQLIEVRRFLYPLIHALKQCRGELSGNEFLELLKKECKSRKMPKDMNSKLRDCSENIHALKTLHSSVANRGEMTKSIIINMMRDGSFVFCIQSGECEVTVSYKIKKQKRSYCLQELSDLKSRALLIVNKDSDVDCVDLEKDKREKKLLEEFIKLYDVIHNIVQTSTDLHRSGHFSFRVYNKKVTEKDMLSSMSHDLLQESEEWDKKLKQARKKHPLLYFVYSDQLWALFNFFTSKKDPDRAKSILQFINRSFQLDDFQPSPLDHGADKLLFVGEQLHRLFDGLCSVNTRLQFDSDQSALSEFLETRLPMIIHQPEGSVTTIKTILKIYGCAVNCYPQPHQILFCSAETKWEEIRLLLLRCVTSGNPRELYCLTDVDLLPNDLQFALVKKMRKIILRSDLSDHSLLCVTCKGSMSHAILGQFPELVQRIQPLHEQEMESCLQDVCPNVKTVTSSVAGTGKSETIIQWARDIGKRLVYFPISGPFNKYTMIRRLKQLRVSSTSVLHIDISEVDNPYLLDIFIFELLVLKMVSSGTEKFVLHTEYVYIEIGNTLKQYLRNALYVCTCFKREDVKWEDYKNYMVSSEISSSSQVVCHYLNALENGSIDNTDISFDQSSSLEPLKTEKCRELLQKYASFGDDMSFTVIETFLKVFADQLRKLSSSQFFQTDALKGMVGKKSDVRSKLVEAMIGVFKTFAGRSVQSYRESQAEVRDLQQSSLIMTAHDMVDRVHDMICWAEADHLLVVFHSQDFSAVSALYRDFAGVPEEISNLFNTQIEQPLSDYAKQSQASLQKVLECIVRTSYTSPDSLPDNYALTPDNLLKMVLIFLRIKAGVPVLIMGETGCGKTSLITYLAMTSGCQLTVFNIHAGIKQQEIVQKVSDVNDEALRYPEMQYWLFMDEINTCDHLGLINEILCHKTCLGSVLPPNVVLLAACNPYKARKFEKILTSGLESKVQMDTRSNLVYRVHPLPESMIDYVWDYGSLDKEDEKAYIARMVNSTSPGSQNMLVDLLSTSQNFTRDCEDNTWCVSLRDVRRCLDLREWFRNYYIKKTCEADKTELPTDGKIGQKSLILSLAHCYYSRLATSEARLDYCENVSKIFKNHGEQITSDAFIQIIRKEQEDLLNRMNLPENTAKNTALRENVFVVLVCILNRMPIFVVGKPGCSKSLSVQLIRSNLRGLDSSNDFFRLLPQVYIVSYQGSESSTSEGIIKIFEKAKRYNENNSNDDVLPVVLLDEIGLAEQSKSNPLKVLHSLLEPLGGKPPEVAVVGISNWALDAAKMNRAIYLSRPEPDEEELFDTAKSISSNDTCGSSGNVWQLSGDSISDPELRAVSRAYYEYQSEQTHRSFHGLRDYYALIKYLSRHVSSSDGVELWKRGLLRNFGGLSFETHTIVNKFLSFIDPLEKCESHIPVRDLVQENVNDKLARHLMLITHGDSALGILENFINLQNREHEIIFGSKFEEDLSEDYNYRMLSRIILCMERGVILVLKDLENIYGSLYDMLNQNYSYVGSKKRRNCRIALGPYSNPMCYVHDDFRCVVLVDLTKVDYSDPPFLNRFEKQLLTFKDVLSPQQVTVIDHLESWVSDVCDILDQSYTFNTDSAIAGYSEDTLPSLVLSLWPEDSDKQDDEDVYNAVINSCKESLIWLFYPDGMLRASKSVHARENPRETAEWQKHYFELPIHFGLRHFIEASLDDGFKKGVKAVIHTRSNIMFHVEGSVNDCLKCQVVRLSEFKSEKQLTNRISNFWLHGDSELLVLQCKPSLDNQHMLLAKSLVDKYRAAYKEKNSNGTLKHVIILVHLDREAAAGGWQFNFLSGWRLVTLDSLAEPKLPIPYFLGKSIVEIFEDSDRFDMCQSIVGDILWAFSCIKYSGKSRSMDDVVELVRKMGNSRMTRPIKERVLTWMRERDCGAKAIHSFHSWQITLVCDTYAMYNSATVVEAFEYYLQQKIREPLVMIVFQLEQLCAWTSFDKYEDFWKDVFFDDNVFSLDDLPSYREVECYNFYGVCLDLSFPFSKLFVQEIQTVREFFMVGYENLLDYEENRDSNGELLSSVYSKHQRDVSHVIFENVPKLYRYMECHDCDDFLDDFCDIVSADHETILAAEERIFITRWAINLHQEDSEQSSDQRIVQLVTNYWVRRDTVHNIMRLASLCKEVACFDVVDLIAETRARMAVTEYPNVKPEERPQNKGSDNECSPETSLNIPPYTDCTSEDDQVTVSDFQQESPEVLLVDAACKAMLPTENIINACNGILNWQYKVNLILLATSQVSSSSKFLHFLRMCNDFIICLQLPHGLEDTNVSVIAECGRCEDDPLESNVMFNCVLDMCKTLRGKVPLPEVQKFFCLYLGRCFDSYQGESICVALDLFLDRISQNDVFDDELHYFGSIIDRILSEELYNFTNLLSDMLSGIDLDCHPNIKKLEDVLCRTRNRNETSLALLTCDIAEALFLKQSRLNKYELEGDAFRALIDKAKTASTHMRDGNKLTLTFIVSVAFMKSFLRSVAQLLKDTKHFIQTNKADAFLQELSALLDLPQNENDSEYQSDTLKIFLLKVLHEDMCFQEIVSLVNEYTFKIPGLQGIEWTESQLVNRIGFKVMSLATDYNSAFLAYQKLLAGDKAAIIEYIRTMNQSGDKICALLSVMADNMYLISGQRELKDTEKESGRLITSLLENFPDYIRSVAKCLSLETQFKLPMLNLSPGTSVRDIQIASVMINIVCMTVAYGVQGQASLLGKALTCPTELKTLFVPFAQTSRSTSDTKTGVLTATCSCMHKIATMSTEYCPVCSTRVEFEAKHHEVKDGHGELSNQAQKGLTSYKPSADYPKSESSSFVVFRILLNSCIAAGYGIMSNDLTGCCRTHNNDESAEAIVQSTIADLKKMWDILETMLVLPSHQVCCFMHGLLYKLRLFLTTSKCEFNTLDERAEWEKIFIDEVNAVIRRRHDIINDTMRRTIFASESSVETTIEELDDDKNEQSELFRFTPEKSKESLFGAFKLEILRNKHQLFELCVAYGQQLSLLQYLRPLLTWQELVSRYKCRRIPRRRANEKIEQVLSECSDSDEKKKLRESLDNFFNSWNKIRPFLLKHDKLFEDLPILHSESSMQDCVAFNVESQVYKVIKTLVEMQNEFLGHALRVAISGECTALSFLLRERSTAVLPTTPLNDATPSQILNFKWKEVLHDLLKFSQFSTAYGSGYKLELDFTAIEKELAFRFVFGKSHLLLDDCFPFFCFAQELSTNSTTLVNLGKRIPQQPLPEPAVVELTKLNSSSPNNTVTVKLELDIVVAMLQRTCTASPDLSIVEYADTWYSVIGKSFPSQLLPQPSSMLKLCHVVSLYGTLEDLLCQNSEDRLPDEYREMLQYANCEELQIRLRKTTVDLHRVTKVLRRFIYRYFSSVEGHTPPDKSQPLHKLLRGQVLSSDDPEVFSKQLSEILTPDVQVRHSYNTVKVIEKVVEEKRVRKPLVKDIVADKKNAAVKRKKLKFSNT